ncbi:MAG: ATP-binding cassette domain-containing protein [Actinomycetaceae bacterium]|nr:ATP-binding cassette domain-containing protein [Actinomycetaceae bacterium]
MPDFKISGLNKAFDIDGTPLHVIKDLELSGNTEEMTVILGRSGCGKTTLLRILCGLEDADSGTFDFPQDSTAVVFQSPNLMPWLTVTKNIAFGLKHSSELEGEVKALIEMTGLEGFENAYPAQLSGGMQHRVAIARALARKPSMVLMDEPFAALDYFTRESMQRELLNIHQQARMGAIFVTHNIDEALLLGDTICIMADGHITAEYRQAPTEGWRDILSPESVALKKKILAGLNNQAREEENIRKGENT